jgi:hypothetical protein
VFRMAVLHGREYLTEYISDDVVLPRIKSSRDTLPQIAVWRIFQDHPLVVTVLESLVKGNYALAVTHLLVQDNLTTLAHEVISVEVGFRQAFNGARRMGAVSVYDGAIYTTICAFAEDGEQFDAIVGDALPNELIGDCHEFTGLKM